MAKYEAKMKETDADVIEFIEAVDHPRKREDAYKLLKIFEQTSGYEAKMWGPSIIGFGTYHYKYASGHEGDAPLVGFSPRKAKHSLYISSGETTRDETLKRLGKYTAGKSCVYINKVEDIYEDVLKEMIRNSIVFIQEQYPNE